MHLINDEDIENLIKEQQKFNNKPSIKFQEENKQEINKNSYSYNIIEEITNEQIKKLNIMKVKNKAYMKYPKKK